MGWSKLTTMHSILLLTIINAVATATYAAQDTRAPSTFTVLQSDDNLSTFSNAIAQVPGLEAVINAATNVTILAPSNEAMRKICYASPEMADALADHDSASIRSMVLYHVLQGQFTPSSVPVDYWGVVAESLLTPGNTFAGQPAALRSPERGLPVYLKRFDDANASNPMPDLAFSSGIGYGTRIQESVNLTGVTIHKVSRVLSLPTNLTTVLGREVSLGDFNYAFQYGAGQNLTERINSEPEITVIMPNAVAFHELASCVWSAPKAELETMLLSHIIPGRIVTTQDLDREQNITVRSLAGTNLTLYRAQGKKGSFYEQRGYFYSQGGGLMGPADIPLKNGIAHLTRRIVLPETEYWASVKKDCFKDLSDLNG